MPSSFQPQIDEIILQLKSYLFKFERTSLRFSYIFQDTEPLEFWSMFIKNRTPKSKHKQISENLSVLIPKFLSSIFVENLYKKNADWYGWFVFLNQDSGRIASKSSRSKKSQYLYGEGNEKKDKNVLFVFPGFDDPFYFFDLDDLQNDSFALLIDPINKVIIHQIKTPYYLNNYTFLHNIIKQLTIYILFN